MGGDRMSKDRLNQLIELVKREFDGSNGMYAAQSRARRELAEWADRLVLFANLNPAAQAAEACYIQAEEIRALLS
jgi:hypothetical protein